MQPDDVLAVRSQPTVRTRVRVLAGGGEQEEQVPVPPTSARWLGGCSKWSSGAAANCCMANLLLRSRGLVEDAQQRVQAVARPPGLRSSSIATPGPVAPPPRSVPLPLLDLFASSALTVKMVVDLARVYRQQIDFDIAVNLLGQLGKNLIAILGVNAAAPPSRRLRSLRC